MSLVIATWDKSLAVVASEGRACMKGPEGIHIPIADDRYKVRRLKGGSILALTGDLNVTQPLRAAIEAGWDVSSFNDTRVSVIPALMAEYTAKHPEAVFGVMLVGNNGRQIEACTWSTENPDSTTPTKSQRGMMGFSVLGCTPETHSEAVCALRQYFGSTGRNYLSLADTCSALQSIICALAERHSEINDRVRFETVIVPGPSTNAMKPLAEGDATIEREVFDFELTKRRIALADSGANVTADHVLTVKSQVSLTVVNYPSAEVSDTAEPISGFGWTALAASSNDVYNISGLLSVRNPVGYAVTYSIGVFVDGDTSTNYAIGSVSAASSEMTPNTPFNAFISGLPAGSHTIQVYLICQPPVDGFQPAVIGSALCQRIF